MAFKGLNTRVPNTKCEWTLIITNWQGEWEVGPQVGSLDHTLNPNWLPHIWIVMGWERPIDALQAPMIQSSYEPK